MSGGTKRHDPAELRRIARQLADAASEIEAVAANPPAHLDAGALTPELAARLAEVLGGVEDLVGRLDATADNVRAAAESYHGVDAFGRHTMEYLLGALETPHLLGPAGQEVSDADPGKGQR